MAEQSSPRQTQEPTEKAMKTLEHIGARFRVSQLPDSFRILAGSESGIIDLSQNLDRQFATATVEEKTKLLTALGVSSALGSRPAVMFFGDAALARGIAPGEIADTIAAAAICAVFNSYYRFRDQVSEAEAPAFESFRAPFNATTMMKGSLAPWDVEAICIAVSSTNGCCRCVESHLAKARKLGMSDQQVDEIIKVSAVAGGLARALAAL